MTSPHRLFQLPRLGLSLALILAGLGAQAEPIRYVSDAFGLVDSTRYAASPRAAWSGHIEILTGPEQRADWQAPQRVADRLFFFVGPKSAKAGVDDIHAVAIAVDAAGNMAPDGLMTQFQPGFGAAQSAPTKRGIADLLLRPPVQAQMYYAGVTLGAVQGTRAEYRVIPDLGSLDLAMVPPTAPLHQETLDHFRSAPIRDRYGNPVEAGIAVHLRLDHADGAVSRIDGVTTGDTADLPVLVRDIDTRVAAHMALGAVQSPPIARDLQKITLQAAPKLRWIDLPEIGGMRLVAGPFLTTSGHLLNDGSAVTIGLEFADGTAKTVQGWTLDGMMQTVIASAPDALPARVQIKAGSRTARSLLDAAAQIAPPVAGGME